MPYTSVPTACRQLKPAWIYRRPPACANVRTCRVACVWRKHRARLLRSDWPHGGDEQVRFRRFPVTVTGVPVTRCQICRRTVACLAGRAQRGPVGTTAGPIPRRSACRPGNRSRWPGLIRWSGPRAWPTRGRSPMAGQRGAQGRLRPGYRTGWAAARLRQAGIATGAASYPRPEIPAVRRLSAMRRAAVSLAPGEAGSSRRV
jgi:hypothetical protein